MSSLANAVKRKTHKERAQPAARRKFGLLEKKKDYVLRAKDFHKKEKTIKHLQRKAEERNPDEFYFAMEKARTKDGVHQASSTEANKYTQEELRLMKTQDEKYVRLKSRVEEEKLKCMKGNLHFIGLTGQAKHTVFVNSAQDAAKFSPAEYFDTPAELLDRAYNRPRKSTLSSQPVVLGDSAEAVAKTERRKLSAYREAAQRQERQQKLAALAEKMAYEKQVMGKGRKRKLQSGDATQPPVFLWKRERKR